MNCGFISPQNDEMFDLIKKKDFHFRQQITEARASRIGKQNEVFLLFDFGVCCACTHASHVYNRTSAQV